jgi:hypothetical protein
MTQVEQLLSQLARVKGRNGSWTACCPAHDDKGPSLAVTEREDGRILMHCFAGCDIADVLGALGMDMNDLFPPKAKTQDGIRPAIKPAFFASDLMRIIHLESLVVQIVAFDIAKGKPVTEETRERMLTAYHRIDEAVRYANV